MKLETLPDILMEVEGMASMRKYSSEEPGSASVRKRQREEGKWVKVRVEQRQWCSLKRRNVSHTNVSQMNFTAICKSSTAQIRARSSFFFTAHSFQTLILIYS